MKIFCKAGLTLFAGMVVVLSLNAEVRRPLYVNQPILPRWAPLWEWESLRNYDLNHLIIGEVTGVQGVGSLCCEGVTHDGHALHLCFAPGTPPEYVDYISRLIFGDFLPAYDASARWTSTSFGSTGSRGNPIRLRWSFVPDGVALPGLSGGSAPSNLFSSMNSKFGSDTTLWQNQFRNSFTRWSQVAGLQYTEVSDDGAVFPNSAGSASAPRGDVRIGARNLDGASGVLAFNYFPNTGDMVLDSSENWQSSSGTYRFLRNTVMHEHGHGLGLGHVIPTNSTKLMEPYLNTNFDGPQDDDIRGAQRLYGDPYELNNTAATATEMDMTNTNNLALNMASLDRTADVDFYRITVPASRKITVTVTPIGSTYQVGPDGGTAITINTRAIQNLRLELRASNGTTVLTSAPDTGIGNTKQVANFLALPSGGTYFARVFSGTGSTDDVQRYEIRVQTTSLPQGDVDGNGCVDDADLLTVLFAFGSSDANVDLNGDGTVDDADLLTVLFNFGSGC